MGMFRGQVFQNPIDTGIKNSLTLINVTNPDTGEKIPGHHTFFQNDILSVTGLTAPPEGRKKAVETVMDTVVLTNLVDLNCLMDALKDNEDVGCYVPGVSMGRFSSPKLIVLNVRYVLVIIPIEKFQENSEMKSEFWKIMAARFFSTDKFTKIFFDSRGTTDYLYNRYSISTKRVLDLQFTEHCLKREMEPSYVRDYDPYYRMESVSFLDLLKEYMPYDVPPCDLSFLGNANKLRDLGPHELNSTEKKYCALRAKYLIKLKYEMFQRIFLPAQIAVERKSREMIAKENVVLFEVRR
ncbi:unnamed protein product [Allacma fusca]|uniref:3'-5' exonuclease domain-containing protein n=1 Tax=Allacma fusca TaxID=39272 RepID=A0A8J2K494_9HEXA|nr:unnamed protein product [Allacma fusca]